MERKDYILLKQSPEMEAGTVISWDMNLQLYKPADKNCGYSKEIVETQPDWFEQVVSLWIPINKLKEVKKKLGLK